MEPSLLHDAERIVEHVRQIWRILRRQIESDVAASGLTAPQVQALDSLVAAGGLTVTELSQRMGLSHSTVSGIIDRLEKRALVARRPDPQDRRYTQVVVSEAVQQYLHEQLSLRTHSPLAGVLRHATPAERAAVLDGLATLLRLLQTHADTEAPP